MGNLRDWLFGDNLDGHEFLIHRAKPRFIARLVDEEGGEGFEIDGLTVSIDDGQTLAEFEWLDAPISAKAWQKLIPEIRIALAAYEEKLEADVERGEEE